MFDPKLGLNFFKNLIISQFQLVDSKSDFSLIFCETTLKYFNAASFKMRVDSFELNEPFLGRSQRWWDDINTLLRGLQN